MHKKFDINRTKIKAGCQSGRKVVPHDPKRDLHLAWNRDLVQHGVALPPGSVAQRAGVKTICMKNDDGNYL